MATKTSKGLKIVPLGDRVVLKREEAVDQTAGGIYLPESAKDKPQRGTVMAIGEGYTLPSGEKQALTVKVGDNVLFTSYGGEEIDLGEETYLLMRESDILATY